jgi:hypothetical protein
MNAEEESTKTSAQPRSTITDSLSQGSVDTSSQQGFWNDSRVEEISRLMQAEKNTDTDKTHSPRNSDGTLKVPLNEEQICENIAIHFPTAAEACLK